jgi:hypothetical protein
LIKTHLLLPLFSAASVLFTLDYNVKAEEKDLAQNPNKATLIKRANVCDKMSEHL